VVPVKDRQRYVDELLVRLPEYLEDLNGIHDYLIVVAEQTDDELFSSSLAKNVGARHAIDVFRPGYLVFQDVDMIPLSGVDYRCRDRITICFLNFGSCRVPTAEFVSANGYNPNIFGWGYEDSEFYDRLESHGFDCERWDRSAEAERAVVIDLDLCNSTPDEDRSFSRWYWRRSDDRGPQLVSPDWPLERYDKASWKTEDIRKRNLSFVDAILTSHPSRRMPYYRENGLNLIDLDSVTADQQGRVVRLRYDAARVFPHDRRRTLDTSGLRGPAASNASRPVGIGNTRRPGSSENMSQE
jgi:hypothetical protein